MEYGAVEEAVFRARPNRFIAQVERAGRLEVCHVKNTGRCRELLVPGAKVYLAPAQNPARKTRFDLVAVEKGPYLINMDSQAPNRVAEEYLPRLFPGLSGFRREVKWGNSRFDFALEAAGERWFLEVKGVTLEEKGAALFPDAPTQRGLKHLEELCRCQQEGYRACVLFVVQMKGAAYFAPNRRTHPEFAEALERAAAQGVRLEAVDCRVTPSSLTPEDPVEIRLGEAPGSL